MAGRAAIGGIIPAKVELHHAPSFFISEKSLTCVIY
jgi:hypothetical protein